MNVLWLSWKDSKHPLAGGAETVSKELMTRLVRDGHSVKLITSRPQNHSESDNIDGVEITRIGNRYTVYMKARSLIRRDYKDWPDLVIDEMNTIPFGAGFYIKKRSILLAYQLAREVWFYQLLFPFSLVGYLLEPLYLRLLSTKYKTVLTESNSTREDMAHYGFKKTGTKVFRVGMALQPLATLSQRKEMTTVLFLGALRPMKRAKHAVQAFEIARDENPELHMIMAGDDSSAYARRLHTYINNSRHAEAIKVLGRVSAKQKQELLKDAAVILVTSLKEGWGLIVTEANSQGTPAIAYDVDGLRDSVKNDVTGYLVRPNPKDMSRKIQELLTDKERYNQIRSAAWEWSKEFTFDNSYRDFMTVIAGTNNND